MGLKTYNYKSKSLGITLPEAYAVLTNLIIQKDNRARAIFAIQTSREAVETLNAVDTADVFFVWDRKTDPAKMAYEKAKTQVTVENVYNEEEDDTIQVTTYGLLYGWQDDYV